MQHKISSVQTSFTLIQMYKIYFLIEFIESVVFREEKGWNVKESLLLDGSYEDPEINLRRVMFWPDNILELLTRFGVRREFDLLSVDMDSYDWWMLERILEGGYRPRVIGDTVGLQGWLMLNIYSDRIQYDDGYQ